MLHILLGLIGFLSSLIVTPLSVVAGRAIARRPLGIAAKAFTSEAAAEYARAPRWRRALWHLVGPIVAYLVCALLAFPVLMAMGEEEITTQVIPLEGSVAQSAGLLEGDRVVSVDGKQVRSWEELRRAIRSLNDREASLVVMREQATTLVVRPVAGRLGIKPIVVRHPIALTSGLTQAATTPFRYAFVAAKAYLKDFFGPREIEVVGPVGVMRMVEQNARETGFWLAVQTIVLMIGLYWIPSVLVVELALIPRSPAVAPGDLVPAERARRFWAWVIDYVLLSVTGALGMVPGAITHHTQIGEAGPWVATILLLCAQWALVAKTGQTLGKRWLGLRIVRRHGAAAGFTRGVLLRSWAYILMASIPYLGIPLVIGGVLAVFGRSSRCLHDYIAGTWVVAISN